MTEDVVVKDRKATKRSHRSQLSPALIDTPSVKKKTQFRHDKCPGSKLELRFFLDEASTPTIPNYLSLLVSVP